MIRRTKSITRLRFQRLGKKRNIENHLWWRRTRVDHGEWETWGEVICPNRQRGSEDESPGLCTSDKAFGTSRRQGWKAETGEQSLSPQKRLEEEIKMGTSEGGSGKLDENMEESGEQWQRNAFIQSISFSSILTQTKQNNPSKSLRPFQLFNSSKS